MVESMVSTSCIAWLGVNHDTIAAATKGKRGFAQPLNSFGRRSQASRAQHRMSDDVQEFDHTEGLRKEILTRFQLSGIAEAGG